VLGEYAAAKLRAKKIAIIDDRTAYGQGLADEFEKAAKATGAAIVAREYTTDKATDFRSILTNVKAKQPDLVFYGGMDAQAGPMAAQMKTLAVKAKFLAGDGAQSPEFIKLAGDAADGVIASSRRAARQMLGGTTELNPSTGPDLRALRLRRGDDPGGGHAEGQFHPAGEIPARARAHQPPGGDRPDHIRRKRRSQGRPDHALRRQERQVGNARDGGRRRSRAEEALIQHDVVNPASQPADGTFGCRFCV
jgi:hypothetical protein